MNLKNTAANITRRALMGRIMRQSGNYLPLTGREKAMIKFFIKFNLALLFLVGSWTLPALYIAERLPEFRAAVEMQTPAGLPAATPARAEQPDQAASASAPAPEVVSATLREVTAYNLGDIEQTDATPCQGANSKIADLCEYAKTHKIAAANFAPFGTRLRINGEIYEVQDRMASRFKNRVDIAMSADEHARALAFGLQVLNVEILK